MSEKMTCPKCGAPASGDGDLFYVGSQTFVRRYTCGTHRVDGTLHQSLNDCLIKQLRRENADLRAYIEKTMWDVSLDHGDTRCVCCFGEYPNHRDKCDLAKLLERTL